MTPRHVIHIISYLLIVLGGAMVICAGVSYLYDDPIRAQVALLATGTGSMVLFALIAWLTRGVMKLSRSDGFGIVTFGWLAASCVGAIPYLAAHVIELPVAAIFETMSGFTTTGASVLSNLESIPRGILLWRALTHFFGGMGVLVLCVAILPFLGVGGMQLFRAEVPGPDKDRLTPRIAVTAKLLWMVYVLLCCIEAILLRFGGMDWFDAWCHTFATMATGGFSTRSASVGAYNSPYIELVITVFMFLAGTNFALHYQALHGRLSAFWKSFEFRMYFLIWFTACLALAINTRMHTYSSTADAVRNAFFTGTSIMTTTGFVTADYELWPVLAQLIVVALMFVGGCAGSTSGGMKVIRLSVAVKAAMREISLFLKPNAVQRVKIGRKPMEQATLSNITGFVLLYIVLFVAIALVMCAFTPDIATAVTASVATISNIGPGLSGVGPMVNFASIPQPGLGILIFSMLLGRLELFTVLVLFLPRFWKNI